MPLFRRPDGDLVRDESPVRVMMPYLLRGRNESVVLHEQTLDVSAARAFLRTFNQAPGREGVATLFHLLLWVLGRALHERPRMNRFVSGGRLYQRRGVYVSFAAKKAMSDDAPIVTIKMELPAGESFAAFFARVTAAIGGGRTGPDRPVDKEARFFARLPGFLTRAAVAFARWLDRHNLMPGSMIAQDPLYTSVFLANLGSLGLDRTYHHLFEWGNAPLFAAMGTARKTLVAGRDGQPAVIDGLEIRWSFDERIVDGFYCAATLKLVQKWFEAPAGEAPASTA